MDGPVDIPYAEIERMMGDLDATIRGEGMGEGNERFIIQRYVTSVPIPKFAIRWSGL
jgi:hypothetical protein